jgi:hypothetical protein
MAGLKIQKQITKDKQQTKVKRQIQNESLTV